MMNQQATRMLCTMTHNLSTKGKRTGVSASRVFAALMFSLIVCVLLVAMLCGTRAYSALQSTQNESNDERVALGLAVNSIRANDAIDLIAAGTGPEGRSLVLRESSDVGDFETRIYLHQGYIVEEYALSGAACTPEKATHLVKSSTFDFSYKNGLLTFTCDQGTSQVALHSVRGGA